MSMCSTLITNAAHCAGVAERLPSAVAGAIEVRMGQGIEGLIALRQDWVEIATRRPDTAFHQRYEWQLSYLHNLELDESSVHFFSFFRNGEPIAIFPLRHIKRTVAGIPLWLWELPFHPHMNLCDCIMAPSVNGAVVMRLLIDTLGRHKDLPWDALHLPNMLDDASALSALRNSALSRTLFVRSGQSMYFPCDDFHSATSCTGKFKRNLRRQRKKLEQLGRVEVSLVRERTALDQAFATFLQLEASGWKGKHGCASAIMLHANRVKFYRNLMDYFAADQNCLISLLKLDGIAIAAQFGVISGTTLFLLKIAYDERFHAEAPGNQLLYGVIRHCCEAKSLARLSLVTGPVWAAERWNPEGHQVWTVYAFNSSLCGLAAYAATRLRPAMAIVA